MRTRECDHVKPAEYFFGHRRHAYTRLGLHGRKAYRCPGVKPLEIVPSVEERTLVEMRRIRELLEKKQEDRP